MCGCLTYLWTPCFFHQGSFQYLISLVRFLNLMCLCLCVIFTESTGDDKNGVRSFAGMEAGESKESQRIVLVGLGVRRCAVGAIIAVEVLKEMEHVTSCTPFLAELYKCTCGCVGVSALERDFKGNKGVLDMDRDQPRFTSLLERLSFYSFFCSLLNCKKL